MKKGEARQIIKQMGLPAPQEKAAQRTIGRATTSEEVDIVQKSSGELVITRSRAGKISIQVFEDTIKADGNKEVVRKAY
jgi:hypothetical protein